MLAQSSFLNEIAEELHINLGTIRTHTCLGTGLALQFLVNPAAALALS